MTLLRLATSPGFVSKWAKGAFPSVVSLVDTFGAYIANTETGLAVLLLPEGPMASMECVGHSIPCAGSLLLLTLDPSIT
jgi:hypothetical protein